METPLLFVVLIMLILGIHSHVSEQLQYSELQTLLKVQNLLGYPEALSMLNNNNSSSSNTDYCNMEATQNLTLACYDDRLTQLHVVGNGNGNAVPRDFSSAALFAALGTSALPTLKVLTLVSLGLRGPLPPTISRLSSLEILNLSSNHLTGSVPPELRLLTGLQSLALDDNAFRGSLSPGFGAGLAVLSMKNNFLSGALPASLATLQTLRVLDLSNNQLSGDLPARLADLANLQVLHLGSNSLGPQFPAALPTKLVSLMLSNNTFGLGLGLPNTLNSLYQLQRLDLSLNRFVGPFPPSLLSLPSINYLDVSSNRFTGMLSPNMSCNDDLVFVNLSSNLLKGELPACLTGAGARARVVAYAGNCLGNEEGNRRDQHPPVFCNNQALAVEIVPHGRDIGRQDQRHRNGKAAVLASSMGGGILLVVGVVIFVTNKAHRRRVVANKPPPAMENGEEEQEEVRVKTTTTTRSALTSRSILQKIIKSVSEKPSAVETLKRSIKTRVGRRRTPPITRSIVEHASFSTAKLLTDARCISQTMKMGTSLPAYRTFAFDELKEATNNFDASSLLSEGPHGHIYKGLLSHGMHVAIRELKMRKRHSSQTYIHHVELISKLRHPNLVSALGHSFECNRDDSTVSTIFLLFEFVPNRTLRSCVSGGSSGEKLSWMQRLAAAIGVVKAIHFLHTGVVPGLYSNNLKITDVLLDNDLNVKISSYNLPLSAENKRMVSNGTYPGIKGNNAQQRIKDADKNDVYDIGVMLLEIILGRPLMFHNEVQTLKDLLQVSIKTDDIARRSIVDPSVHKECADESLMTMMEICVRCLSADPAERPSVDDVLWNLQFAAQVQNSCTTRDSLDPPAPATVLSSH